MNLCINTRQLFTRWGQRWGGFTWSPCPCPLQISYLTTITIIHRRTKTQKSSAGPALRSPEPRSVGGAISPGEAQTSYGRVHATSVPSYGRHFTPSKPSCFGICCVGAELVWSQLCYVGRGLQNQIWEYSVLLCVQSMRILLLQVSPNFPLPYQLVADPLPTRRRVRSHSRKIKKLFRGKRLSRLDNGHWDVM